MVTDKVRELVQEIINYVERRYRLEEQGWELRSLHREALEKFVERVLHDGECRAIVQMPTGAGKSVLLATLTVACSQLRDRLESDGGTRDVILILAPLVRIKHQLHLAILKAGGIGWGGIIPHLQGSALGDLSGLYHTALIGDEEFVLNGSEKLIPEGCEKISQKLRYVLSLKDGRCKAILMNAQAISALKDRSRGYGESLLDQLADRLLAVFVDEIHFLFTPGEPLGILLGKIVKETKIALGFTATPLRECFEVLGIKWAERLSKGYLLGRPVHSTDLAKQTEGILIKNLHTIFYRTYHKLENENPSYKLGKEDVWRKACRNRVTIYVENLLKDLSLVYGNDYLNHPMKVLILAPNIKEARFWYEILGSYLQNHSAREIPIYLVHSKVNQAQSLIEKFVKSNQGFLIAVDMLKLGFDDPDLDVLVIARPLKNPVAYVQARGRVVRCPRNKESLKAKKGALLIHFACDRGNPYVSLENEERIKSVEKGIYRKNILKSLEFFGYETEEVEDLEARVKVEKIGSTIEEDRYILTELEQVEENFEIQYMRKTTSTASLDIESNSESKIVGKWRQVYDSLVKRLKELGAHDPERVAAILVNEAQSKGIDPPVMSFCEKSKSIKDLLSSWHRNVLRLDWYLLCYKTRDNKNVKFVVSSQDIVIPFCVVSFKDIIEQGERGLADLLFKKWEEWRRTQGWESTYVSDDLIYLELSTLAKEAYISVINRAQELNYETYSNRGKNREPLLDAKMYKRMEQDKLVHIFTISYYTMKVDIYLKNEGSKKILIIKKGDNITIRLLLTKSDYSFIKRVLSNTLPIDIKDRNTIIKKIILKTSQLIDLT